jgi:hypothetical protein
MPSRWRPVLRWSERAVILAPDHFRSQRKARIGLFSRQALEPPDSGLGSPGYVDVNLRIECRRSEGHDERLSALAAEWVQLKIDLIVATSGTATGAAKSATDDSSDCDDVDRRSGRPRLDRQPGTFRGPTSPA